MCLHIGKRITKMRSLRGLNQDILARGIISRTHLSNIENGRYHPEDDILLLLANRLDAPIEYLSSPNKKSIELDVLLKQLRTQIELDLNEPSELIIFIQSSHPYITAIEQELLFSLLKIYQQIKLKLFENAKNMFQEEINQYYSESEIHQFNMEIQELYLYTRGVLYYYSGEYHLSKKSFQKQLNISNNNYLISDIYYNLALNHYQLNNYYKAKEYVHKALDCYQSERNWKKIIDVHLLTGIILYKLKLFNDSLKYYEESLRLSEKINYEEIKEKIYHNIALVYKRMDDYIKSNEYLNLCLKLCKSNLVQTYSLLIENYICLGSFNLIPEILTEAEKNCFTELDTYYLIKSRAFYWLKMGNENQYEILMNDLIIICDKYNFHQQLINVREELSNFYEVRKKYKQAYLHLKLVYKKLKENNERWI